MNTGAPGEKIGNLFNSPMLCRNCLLLTHHITIMVKEETEELTDNQDK